MADILAIKRRAQNISLSSSIVQSSVLVEGLQYHGQVIQQVSLGGYLLNEQRHQSNLQFINEKANIQANMGVDRENMIIANSIVIQFILVTFFYFCIVQYQLQNPFHTFFLFYIFICYNLFSLTMQDNLKFHGRGNKLRHARGNACQRNGPINRDHWRKRLSYLPSGLEQLKEPSMKFYVETIKEHQCRLISMEFHPSPCHFSSLPHYQKN